MSFTTPIDVRVMAPQLTVTQSQPIEVRSGWVQQVLKMLATGNVETEWLSQQGVNVVYARLPGGLRYTKFNNSDLAEVRPGVYLVLSSKN